MDIICLSKKTKNFLKTLEARKNNYEKESLHPDLFSGKKTSVRKSSKPVNADPDLNSEPGKGTFIQMPL